MIQRTEREIKRLHQDIDRENQAHAQLSAWEASQAQAKVCWNFKFLTL